MSERAEVTRETLPRWKHKGTTILEQTGPDSYFVNMTLTDREGLRRLGEAIQDALKEREVSDG